MLCGCGRGASKQACKPLSPLLYICYRRLERTLRCFSFSPTVAMSRSSSVSLRAAASAAFFAALCARSFSSVSRYTQSSHTVSSCARASMCAKNSRACAHAASCVPASNSVLTKRHHVGCSFSQRTFTASRPCCERAMPCQKVQAFKHCRVVSNTPAPL